MLITQRQSATNVVMGSYSQTSGQGDSVLEKNIFKMFSLHTHTASMNKRPKSQGDMQPRGGGRDNYIALPLE